MDHDSGGDGDREHDTLTFVLAAVLAAIVLGAIGYGVFNSSKVTTAIPSLAPDRFNTPSSPPAQASTTGAR